jgi:ATP-dependent DNA helicase RecG
VTPTLISPLRAVVGDKTAKALEKGLGMRSVGDLLRHYPRRYAERGVLTPLNDLAPDEMATVMAEVVKVDVRPMRQRRGSIATVVVSDGNGTLELTFFNAAWMARRLRIGQRGLFAGKVGSYKGKRQLVHPQTQLLDDDAEADPALLMPLIPIYPATSDIASWNIAKSIRIALEVVELGDDPVPDEVRARHQLLPLADALRAVHRPDSLDDVRRAQQRLKWDEALPLQVLLAQRRAAAAADPAVARRPRPDGLLAAFDGRLPFALTAGQQSVSAEILDDLGREHPMYRLLQGEVGSGKTVVAVRAMLAVADSGGQSALLAPTEVLAQQHARTIRSMLGPLAAAGELGSADVATRVALLTGSQGAAERRRNLLDAASGAAGIVVGTHALLQEHVQFADLGLVVVDEQHRFGVEQRDALRAKAAAPPHLLVMTATPIPRTVAMTVYGDLETSTLTELPGGRSPIQSVVVALDDKPQWLERVWARVGEEVEAGRQAYVVCPRISADASGDEPAEPTDYLDEPEPEGRKRPAAAVEDVAPMLEQGPLTGVRLGVLHGRLPTDAKDEVMARFLSGSVDVLVATTVIEVGVDVPNATVMVVLDADRFGISQLHQLRGRIGRGAHAGLCLLVTDAPADTPARERVDGVAATTDGFALARLDLEQRREGDVLGAVQSGRRSTLKLLRLLRDEQLIASAREEAVDLVDADPTLSAYDGLVAAIRDLLDTDRAEYLEKT